jgi:hypothetical protein
LAEIEAPATFRRYSGTSAYVRARRRCPGGLIWDTGRFHVKSELFNRIKLILAVQSSLKKFSAFHVRQIISTSSPCPASHKGRFAIVTNAGRDAVDADGAADERAHLADGEVVWS